MLHHPNCMLMSGMLLGVTATGEKHVKEVSACFITLIACE